MGQEGRTASKGIDRGMMQGTIAYHTCGVGRMTTCYQMLLHIKCHYGASLARGIRSDMNKLVGMRRTAGDPVRSRSKGMTEAL